MPRYKCKTCGLEGEIDKDKKFMSVEVKLNLPTGFRITPRGIPLTMTTAGHPDCEFNKPVTEINLDKLERLPDSHMFEHEKRGVR